MHIQEKQAEAKLLLAAQDLQFRVAEAYFNALAGRDAVILSRAQLAAAKRQFEDADARYRKGLARRTDQLDAQARMAQVELAPPDPLSIDEWVNSAREGNIDLQVQRMVVDVADYEVKRSKAAHYPTLDLQLSHTQNTTDGSLFGGGSETESNDITLAFALPLYSGGGVAAKRKETVSRREQARDELVRVDRAIERQTRAAYQGIISSIRRVDALAQSVKAQELAVETKRRGFGSGLYTSMAVLDAEEDLFLDRRQYAQSRYDYLINWVKLRRAAGQLTESDIIALNRQLGSVRAVRGPQATEPEGKGLHQIRWVTKPDPHLPA